MKSARTTDARDLTDLPGVGPATAHDLRLLGIRMPDDLRGRDPAALYDDLCAARGARLDRCVLYVFRCAVYWASTPHPDPALRHWWQWTDDGPAARRGLVRARPS